MMRYRGFWIVLLCVTISSSAIASERLDELVRSVREEALREAAHDQERIERFLDEQERQRDLLADATARRAPRISVRTTCARSTRLTS